MERAYPVNSDGMPIPTIELELRPSTTKGESLHHLHYNARFYGRFIMTQTLRDLECDQELMRNDQHNLGKYCLHALYSPPKPPTPRQTMDRLEYAKLSGFDLNVRQKGLGYVKKPFTDELWDKILEEYNGL